DQKLDRLVNFARDEMEVLKAQLEARRALLQIGEARLVKAKAWHDRYQALFRAGMVTDERLKAAKDDVLMMEAHVAGERAEVKLTELRLRQAQRRLDYGELPEDTADIRIAEMEHRLASMELQIDRLQHEVGRLRREVPFEDR
ncbi:MAG: hypothetical protein K2X91_10570, partial [Thermoleophilia bacterium]|nr:hypothetical protein [Thermoleophilia bacterium]